MWAALRSWSRWPSGAYQYGITKDGYGEENAITVNGMALSSQEQSQRRELVREIQAKGYDQVVEEVAYTWFNRFIVPAVYGGQQLPAQHIGCSPTPRVPLTQSF